MLYVVLSNSKEEIDKLQKHYMIQLHNIDVSGVSKLNSIFSKNQIKMGPLKLQTYNCARQCYDFL